MNIIWIDNVYTFLLPCVESIIWIRVFLKELPSSIGNLRELTVLNLDKNRLRELPYTVYIEH